MNTIEFGLKYLSQGFQLTPVHAAIDGACSCNRAAHCPSVGKHPAVSSWQQEPNWITDEEQLRHISDYNLGILTGEPSGIFVVDIDPDNDGDASLRRLAEDYSALPATRIHRTGSGGRHFFFRYPDSLYIGGNANKALRSKYPGIDIKGTGGMVVAPPSVSGKGLYEVANSNPIAEAPDWLLDLITTPVEIKTVKSKAEMPVYAALTPEIRGTIDAYCANAIETELSRFRTEYETGQWDNLTNEISFRLLMLANSPWNNWEPDTIVQMVLDSANTDAGFPLDRVVKCVNSAIDAVNSKGLVRDMPPAIEAGIPKEVKQLAVNTFTNGVRTAKLTSAADIVMKRCKWMWKDRIAMGTLSLLAGQPGMGKSTLVYWLVAQLTRGQLFGEFEGQPKDVIIAATEDDWSFTIVPRLVAAGADRSRVYRIDIVNRDDVREGLNLIDDRVLLRQICETKDVGLLVLDPLMSRIGNKDSHKDAEVRQALEPIADMASELGFAVLGLMHFNKSGRTDPLSLVMGSTAFSAVARSVHTVVADPDDTSNRIFGTVKNNLGKISGESEHDLDTWVFHIETAYFDTEDEDPQQLSIGRLVWDGDAKMTVQDSIAAKSKQDQGKDHKGSGGTKGPSKYEQAVAFLSALFTKHGGKVTRAYAIEAGQSNMLEKHSRATLDRAINEPGFASVSRFDHELGKKTAFWGFDHALKD